MSDAPEHDAAVCSFCDVPKAEVRGMLVFVKERFYICEECVEDAQAAIAGSYEKRWRDEGSIEYDSWGIA